MPRAKRHFLPGYAWHITHRCHDRKFLLKFNRDKKRWLYWLYQAKKRFDLPILNYSVTSNHIHLLVLDNSKSEEDNPIAKCIHLAAGRTAWEFNQRKKRRGSFWEDRYQATAVQKDSYLLKCMIYIDLNMVRAGVVKHPCDWPFCGYQEILQPTQRKKKRLIDLQHLLLVFDFLDVDIFRRFYNKCLDDKLKSYAISRERKWTESLAVGSQEFIEFFKEELGDQGRSRDIVQSGDKKTYELREDPLSYKLNFGAGIDDLEA